MMGGSQTKCERKRVRKMGESRGKKVQAGRERERESWTKREFTI